VAELVPVEPGRERPVADEHDPELGSASGDPESSSSTTSGSTRSTLDRRMGVVHPIWAAAHDANERRAWCPAFVDVGAISLRA